ncbi:DUF4256 domain-containing protein [Flavobacterium sp. GCM10023249]|uniref:DUF4256 domain-containing protein n=1 Tax=unclassified Flavobacterium TaxID=196869 RepID=UPI00360A0D22
MSTKKELSPEEINVLYSTLKNRFEMNMQRHKAIRWEDVQIKLESSSDKLWSLNAMETTGGEPDVVGYDTQSDEFLFFDCSAETPSGRRSICYDQEALDSRKENKPKDSAVNMAKSLGITILTEEEYRTLQQLGNFDTKTSSWIDTPSAIRKLGGAVFCDFRYNTVFLYHNGAESYYAARGFRGSLRV